MYVENADVTERLSKIALPTKTYTTVKGKEDQLNACLIKAKEVSNSSPLLLAPFAFLMPISVAFDL